MQLSHEEQAELLDCLLEAGQLLLESGAEISRIEDTITRIGKAYGARQVDAFVITSLISLSLEFSGTDFVSETRRIHSSSGTDFTKLERVNALSRKVCAYPVPVSEFHESLNAIAEGRKPFRVILIGSILAAGGFAVFFGGSVLDGIVSAAFAVEICLLQRYVESTKSSTAAANLLISFIVGVCVGLTVKVSGAFGVFIDMDKILIGDIMLLIPGLAVTNAVRNMLVGNTISGAVRLIEGIIWAGALAGGFMTALIVLGL